MSITQLITFPIEEPLTNLTEDVDLVVTSFIVPSTAVIGVPFNISWTVTNQGTETTTIPSWEDRAYYSFDDIFGNDLYLGNPVIIDDAQRLPLAPGESYTVNATVELTDSLGAGDYYLFVEADSLDYQAETDNTNNFASAVITGTKSPVDLELTSVNAPSSAKPGDEIELSWTVANIGTEVTDASSWLDNVYLYTGNDTISLGELLVSTPITDVLGLPLDPGESYTVNTTVKLPDTIIPGPYYFNSYYLRFYTDYGDDQAESSSFNNFASVPITIPITPPDVDLVVISATAPPTIVSGESIELSWTVTNQGTVVTDPFGTDGIFLSTDETFDSSDSVVTYVYTNDYLPLEPGESYTIDITDFSPVAGAGDYYLLFIADVFNGQFETDEDNNVKAIPVTVTTPNVDLVVTSFIVPSTTFIGVPFNISWTVTNQGTEATTIPSWEDKVVYSYNDILESVLDPYLTIVNIDDTQGLPLAPGESYTIDATVELSDSLGSSDYYLFVEADSLNYQPETDNLNNIASAVITATKSSVDLELTSVNAPSSVQPGDDIELSWTVTNVGTEVTDASSWFDRVVLETGDSLNPYELLVSYPITDVIGLPLAPGESYTINTTVKLPDTLDDDFYYLRFYTNYEDDQAESNGFNNSQSFLLTIPLDVDLVVTSATAPPTIISGESPELSWTVTNQGTVTTNSSDSLGYDGVFLSTDETFDPSDSLVTSAYTADDLPLEPGESYTIDTTFSSVVADAGDYYLLFVADVYDYQGETDEDNNVKAIPITVTTPDVDLVVTAATAPPTIISGESIELSWTVMNQGSEITTNSFGYDGVYLSTDETFDFPDSFVTNVFTADYLPLEPGESYTINTTVSSVVADAGARYLLFVTDVYDYQGETDEDNNVKAIPITVTPSDVDLVTSDVSTPTVGIAGSAIDLSWTVTNQGTDATTVPYWYDYVLFSTDTVYDFIFSPNPDTPVTLKGLFQSDGDLPLAPGESYTVNQSGTIPDVAPGLYYLLFGNNAYNFQPDIDPGNDVVVVPFSIVQSTMSGSSSSESLTGTDDSESIEALEGRDQILAGGGDDVIIGGTGGDTITGGAGVDRFIYRILQDIGDTIVDFTVNEDKLDFSELLDSFSYQGSNPVTDGYLRWIQGSNGTSVQVDADGSTGSGIFRPFIFLENVAANDLTLSDFLI